MGYKYKVTFTKNISNVVKSGYSVIVEGHSSSRPMENEIKNAAEQDGVKIGGNSIGNTFNYEKI